MTRILILPQSSATLPPQLADAKPQEMPWQKNLTWLENLAVLQEARLDPELVLGSANAPALAWLAAKNLYADAAHALVERSPEGERWVDVESGEVWQWQTTERAVPTPTPATEEESKPSEQTIKVSSPEVQEAPPPVSQGQVEPAPKPAFVINQSMSQWKDEKLLKWALIRASWEESEENREFLENCRYEAGKRRIRSPNLGFEVEKAIRNGHQAKEIYGQYETKWKKRVVRKEREAWLEKVLQNRNQEVADLVRKSVAKLETWLENKIQQAREQKQLKKETNLPEANKPEAIKTETNESASNKPYCEIQPICIAPGGTHPNSLKFLQAHNHWQILIDETGMLFGEDAGTIPLTEKTLGKVVALAIPVGKVTLPPLASGFHAVSASVRQVNAAINSLLSTSVGVFGFTVKDCVSRYTPRWYMSVHTLMRWVLRQLPLLAGQPGRVEFLIEQRGDYQGGQRLVAVEEILKHELRSLDAERYKATTLTVDVIGKEGSRYNGYVDTIAHTFNDMESDRMKRTGWMGHCLLRPSDQVMERVLMMYQGEGFPSAGQWYELVTGLTGKEANTLGSSILKQLGEAARKEPAQWQACLDEVQTRLREKRFTLPEIVATLGWLHTWKPEGVHLPPRLRLQWCSASLACANHLGEVETEQQKELITLANDLYDECIQEVCEAELRAAVACTNAYRFDLAEQVLTRWLEVPVAAVGLKLAGKVLSQRGQLAAFTGRTEEAVKLFESALGVFAKLSNPNERRAEARQTEHYRLVALMDSGLTGAVELHERLTTYFQSVFSGRDWPKQIAQSEEGDRFNQFLFVRACALYPEAFGDEITAYLAARESWYSGENHPWPLIDFYRGCLLHTRGDADAGSFVHNATERCLVLGEEAPLMGWMGVVLNRVALSTGMKGLAEVALPEGLAGKIPALPLDALANKGAEKAGSASGLGLLAQLLPFNFH